MGIIYKITNLINGKIYIGQTTQSLQKRWWGHTKHNECPAIRRAIVKYGKENFTIEEIDGANSITELNYREEHHIYMYNSLAPNGYNLTTGGHNKKFSDETRKKISESTKGHKRSLGKKHTQESKDKISENNRKRKQTEYCLNHLRTAFKGKKHTEESKRKISESLKKAFRKKLTNE